MESCEGAESLSGEWVSAHDAIDMLLPMYGKGMGLAAAMALAKRAHSGLVKTRARLFKWEEPKGGAYGGSQKVGCEAEFAILDKSFWWAEGHEALTQNWVSGDFSTWIDHKFHLQAFGVEFDRSDLEAMLPKLSRSKTEEAESEPRSDSEQTAANAGPLPSDEVIEAKMQELSALGMKRDVAAKVIRQISGFEAVGNEHARRTVVGKLPRGRPKTNPA